MHRDSREFVLKIYKPWLPQFAGSAEHAKCAALLSKYRPSKSRGVSCLHSVCFDMEHDTLFCRGTNTRRNPTPWPLSLFGRIEESCLRNLAANVDGYLNFPRVVEALENAKNLECPWLLEATPSAYAMISDAMMYKVGRTIHGLKRRAEKDKLQPKVLVPNYVSPIFRSASISAFITEAGLEPSLRRDTASQHLSTSYRGRLSSPSVQSDMESESELPTASPIWTTYKYPARSSSTPRCPSMVEQYYSTQKPSSRKRKADVDPEAEITGEPRLPERAKRMKMWIRAQERRKDIPENRTRVPSTAGASSSSPPQSAAASSPPQSDAASSRPPSNAESLLDNIERSDGEHSEGSDSGSESSRWDSEDDDAAFPQRIPRELHAHRFNFDIGATELLVEWEIYPEMESWEWTPKADLLPVIPVMITAFLDNNQALEAGTPVRFHQRNSGAVGFDFLVEFEGYPEEIYWTWVPESNLQARVPDMVDEWMAENSSEVEASRTEESIDEQILAEQNYAENVRTGEAEGDTVREPVKQEDSGDADAGEANVKDAEDSTAEYIPKRFVAQRDTPDGHEILVEWEDYPDEKDWTWEPVNNLQEDAPEMVKAWKASRKAKKVSKVYEVESILGKRKIKGEWHYIVKWKGFSKDEATSLEPCGELAVDVPDLVEAFESRRPKRGRPKKTTSA